MMTEIRVRPPTVEDTEAVRDLIVLLGYDATDAFVRERIADFSARPSEFVAVAVSGDKVAGFISVHLFEFFHAPGLVARISALAAHPSVRRTGVGRRLMEAAERFAREKGCVKIEVTTRNHRTDAHAFYTALGYAADSTKFVKLTTRDLSTVHR